MIEKVIDMPVEEQDGQPYVKRFFRRIGNEIILFLPLTSSNEVSVPYVKHGVFEQDLNWEKSFLTGVDMYYKVQDIWLMLKVTIKLGSTGDISLSRIRQLSYDCCRGDRLYLREVPMVISQEVRNSVLRILSFQKCE